jgi:hypothetical protein
MASPMTPTTAVMLCVRNVLTAGRPTLNGRRQTTNAIN